jgi:hypothetical protein
MAILWKHLIQFAPQIISVSRELLSRTRSKPKAGDLVRAADPEDLAQRLSALEENERRQAELVERMALQLSELSQAVLALRQRQRWLAGGILVLAVALSWAFFFARSAA